MIRWEELTRRTLEEVARCEPIYRPTTFWGPGIRRILDDLAGRGLETFKSWPSAGDWFYPTYGGGLSRKAVDAAFEAARRVDADVHRPWFRASLAGGHQARRDFDAARVAWDQARWPFDLEGLGESEAGRPPQGFPLATRGTAQWTRPYLNYLLCLSGLSRHVDSPPRRFLELGGGYGVLGEILLSRDPEAVYVDLDLPPLLTVASFYLDTLFGDRVATYDAMADAGQLGIDGSACLPNWRLRDIRGPFDVFVNSFSFQEMEPEVLERYASDVAALDVTWVVSLNSRTGKAVQNANNPIGVRTPVTSQDIVDRFVGQGYRHVATYADPLIQHNGELAILRRDDGSGPRSPAPAARGEMGGTKDHPSPAVDLRRAFIAPSKEERKAARRTKRDQEKGRRKGPRKARRGFRGRVRLVLRSLRRRLRFR